MHSCKESNTDSRGQSSILCLYPLAHQERWEGGMTGLLQARWAIGLLHTHNKLRTHDPAVNMPGRLLSATEPQHSWDSLATKAQLKADLEGRFCQHHLIPWGLQTPACHPVGSQAHSFSSWTATLPAPSNVAASGLGPWFVLTARKSIWLSWTLAISHLSVQNSLASRNQPNDTAS